MTTPFSYTTQYILNKAHFRECYSQSVITDNSVRAYSKSVLLSAGGLFLVFYTQVNAYIAWFIFCLGCLEALSVYYHKAWWVMRQVFSKAANSEVTLTIDEEGITSQSVFVELKLEWQAVKALTATELGWLVEHAQGKNYISASCLSEQAIEFLTAKSESLKGAE
jgi:hypothetical protein